MAILLMGVLEVAGVASILPFMQLISSPDPLEMSSLLGWTYDFFGFSNVRQMLIYFGAGIMVFITLTSLFSVFTTWLQYKYSWSVAHHLSTRLLRSYLAKPYQFFLKTNSAELKAYVVSEVNSLTGGVIIPLIEVASRFFVAVVIFVFLCWVDIKIAFIMSFSLGGAYLLIYLAQRQALRSIGQHRIAMNMLRYKSLQELLEGIKTITVFNSREFFYDRFSESSKEFCDVQPKYNLMMAAPRYLLELLAFGSILGVTIYLYIKAGDIQNAIPRLSLYAVAGYRLLPALQRAFAALAKLRHNYPIVEKLYHDLEASLNTVEPKLAPAAAPLPLAEKLSIDRLTFSYEGSEQVVIDNFSLDIFPGETVAFIGSTGSGKTTLVDLIVGLLDPKSGQILVDGQPLTPDKITAWRSSLAYVPQEVFLFDDTVLNNLTLGLPEVDTNKLEHACRLADIHDFIINNLPQGFATEIGERGVRLSGGQRQRLGLARALYAEPEVLILDEATSALDSITENGIIDSLNRLPRTITKIVIAHRLSTVRHADRIYILRNGRIVDQGTFDSLLASNDAFKTMVELS
ncbi:MAG: ABC transporter ATP-binding protein [Bacteroidota bacterium]